MKSNFLNINVKDIIKSFVMVVLTTLATALLKILQTNDISSLLDWNNLKSILLISLTSGIVYLLKNFLTDHKDNFLKSL